MQELREWAVEENVSRSSVTRLLKLLHRFHPELPQDYRTLLNTPRMSDVERMGRGEFIYFGFKESLLQLRDLYVSAVAQSAVESMNIQVNIDGAAVNNSGLVQTWPIQCRVTEPFVTKPFLVGAYAGPSKPESVDVYLQKTIAELHTLLSEGLGGNVQSSVVLSEVVCDKPARAYAQQGMSHTGYYGCEKCLDR